MPSLLRLAGVVGCCPQAGSQKHCLTHAPAGYPCDISSATLSGKGGQSVGAEMDIN